VKFHSQKQIANWELPNISENLVMGHTNVVPSEEKEPKNEVCGNNTHEQIPVTSNQNWYIKGVFGILCIMDHSKDNLKNNYLLFEPNYFISF